MPIATANPIAQILESVSQLKALSSSRKSQANEFLERRLGLLAHSISSSPYDPYLQKDTLNLNRDFPGAVCKWFRQFPDSQRLGFLTIALSTVYITKQEMDLMSDIAYQRLRENLAEWDGFRYDSSAAMAPSNLVPYSVSEFSEFSEFLHRAGFTGTRDRSFRPYRTLDEFLAATVNQLRMVADGVAVYDDQNRRALDQLIRSLLNHHVILLEDCSFSGTRVKKIRDQVLDLLDVLFSPYQSILRDKGYSLPTLSLLVICGTFTALTSLARQHASPTRYAPIFGAVFGEGTRGVGRLPDNVQEFSAVLGMEQPGLHAKMVEAVDWFWETFGRRYPETTRVGSTAHFDVTDLRWGYGGKKAGGWTIVTHHNCPNNSLMPLWYPSADTQGESLEPLFGRIESHLDHSEPVLSFDKAMDVVRSDTKKRLAPTLSPIYKDLS